LFAILAASVTSLTVSFIHVAVWGPLIQPAISGIVWPAAVSSAMTSSAARL